MATATMTYAERSTLEVPSLPEPPATSRTPSLSSIAAAQSEINSESRSHSASPAPPIPTDFRSSLSAWWASSGYRDARIAEDRLLRRMSFYRPEQAEMAKSSPLAGAATPAEDVPVPAPSDTGLVATLRSVFIPTPDPKLAPLHPSDKPQPASAEGSESTSLSSQEKKKRNRMSLHRRKSDDSSKEKLVDYINTLEISREDLAGSKEAVVVVHGYAAAFGFFFRNWEAIANSAAETGRRTFFLDWLGMGASSRPSPALLASPVNTPVEQRVARAEHFFLSSLESWRQEVGIEKMVLVGHSLGGYLASAYAIQYPENVSSLILVSPAGIPTVEDEKPKPIGKGPNSHPAHERVSLDAAADAVEIEMQNPKEPEKPKATFMSTALRKTFIWGWEKGLSPFSVLRGLGPWGPLLVGKYSTRRFAAQDPNDVRDLHSYIYATSVLKGSGEFCISHILKPGAYARMPIAERIHGLRMPVTFLYGDNDWMDIAGGLAVEHILNEEGNKDVQVHCVPRAGHHLYLDNPDFTNVILDLRIKSAPPVAAA